MRITDKMELWEMFPLPSRTVPTRGIQAGVILQFKTFYLKIYDDQKEDAYLVQGFRYHEQHPVFERMVPTWEFRDFGRQFTQEDHLMMFQQPCDDPECIVQSNRLINQYPNH